jgi:hypothetical protein
MVAGKWPEWIVQPAHFTVYMGHEKLSSDTNSTQHPYPLSISNGYKHAAQAISWGALKDLPFLWQHCSQVVWNAWWEDIGMYVKWY